MQTRKVLFVIGLVATLAALAQTSIAKDTPEQIKAREALRQKMAELDAAATPPTPAPVVAPTPPVAPVAAPAKKAPVAPVAPVAPAPVPPPPPAPTPTTAAPGSPIFGPVPEAVEDAKTAQLREAVRREMAALQTSPTVERQPVKSGRAPVFAAPPELTPPTMEVPLSPLTGSKATRMAELLQRYNADQISPKDYHTQRAAILAEP